MLPFVPSTSFEAYASVNPVNVSVPRIPLYVGMARADVVASYTFVFEAAVIVSAAGVIVPAAVTVVTV